MSLDDFFYYFSKGVIIIPLIVIILSLIIRFNQNQNSNYLIKNNNSFIEKPSPTKNLNKLNINLNDRWLCHYKIDDQEYQLAIDKRKITLEATISGQFKKYDLSSYAFFVENMLNMDIGKLEFLAKPYLPKGVDLKTLIDSCKKN